MSAVEEWAFAIPLQLRRKQCDQISRHRICNCRRLAPCNTAIKSCRKVGAVRKSKMAYRCRTRVKLEEVGLPGMRNDEIEAAESRHPETRHKGFGGSRHLRMFDDS